jgi:chemotaxis protein CheC
MGIDADYGKLQLSAIYEVANIGLGHATTALSEITGHSFNMSIPNVSSVALENLPNLLGGPEQLTIGVYMPISGDVEGHIAFLFPWASAQALWQMLLGSTPASPTKITDLEASAMLEIGNIINSSFLNAISDMADLQLHANPPLVAVEMAGAIVASIESEAEADESIAIAVQTEIFDATGGTSGYFLCLPKVASLNRLLDSLGVGGVR